MSLIDVNWDPPPKDLRVFAVLQMVFFGVVAALVYRRTGSLPWAAGIAGASACVGCFGLAVPRGIRYLYVGWMALAFPVGWVVSHVVLGVVYFGLFTLFGLGMRLFGGDPMNRRLDRSAASYWKKRSPPADPGRYFRQF